MTHDGQVFSMEQCTNLYFHHVKVINDLVESFQMYANHMYYHPDSTAEYKTKQSHQAAYYEEIIRNIDVILQTDQVAHIHEGFPLVPCPRYTPSWYELENDNMCLICSQLMQMQIQQIKRCKSFTWSSCPKETRSDILELGT